MFLFHTGSIKRETARIATQALKDEFLFHTGSIKSWKQYLVKGTLYVSFYSILVRLKAQFQDCIDIDKKGFYSILVRLKAVSPYACV